MKTRITKPPAGDYILHSVDLGKHKVGVATWLVRGGRGTLLRTWTVRAPSGGRWRAALTAHQVKEETEGHGYDLPEVFVAEWPVKYPNNRKEHKDIDTLLKVGRWFHKECAQWSARYSPGTWKGQVPKGVHRKRIAAALTSEELELMPPMTEHDAWDAVGIGLYALGRTKRGAIR